VYLDGFKYFNNELEEIYMFNILNRLGNWFEKKMIGSLRSSVGKGFWTIKTDSKDGTSFDLLSIESGRLFRLFPVVRVKKLKSIPIATLFLSITDDIRETSLAELKPVPGNIIESATRTMQSTGASRTQKALAATSSAVSEIVSSFDENHLRTLVRNDRNDFRKKLLEGMGKEASAALGKIAKKHLANLVLRIRQEALADDTANPSDDKAGPLALPTGTRFIIRKGKMTVFIIEQPPQTRSIKLMDDNGMKSEICMLAMPYVVFMVVMRGRKSDAMYAFFRKKPLRSMSDELFNPALPNMLSENKVCFSPAAAKPSLAETAEESIANYWGGRFIKTHDPKSLTKLDFDRWVDLTRTNPLFALSYDWNRTDKTPDSMIVLIQKEFAVEGEKQKDADGGKKIMQTLNTFVDSMEASAANELKEVCFNMVVDWKIKEEAFAPVIVQFNTAISGIGKAVKRCISEGVGDALSDDALRSALDLAIKNSTASINQNAKAYEKIVCDTIEKQMKGS
jgi:hypothetical protein